MEGKDEISVGFFSWFMDMETSVGIDFLLYFINPVNVIFNMNACGLAETGTKRKILSSRINVIVENFFHSVFFHTVKVSNSYQ